MRKPILIIILSFLFLYLLFIKLSNNNDINEVSACFSYENIEFTKIDGKCYSYDVGCSTPTINGCEVECGDKIFKVLKVKPCERDLKKIRNKK